MAKDPAFPWYASDWLGSNLRAMLTLEQQGAYINLLCRQWTDPTCSLPDDDEALACLSELGLGWLKGACHLLRKGFPKHPELEGRIANPRLLEVRVERDDFLAKSSKGGKKSGKVRAAKARQKRTSARTKGGSSNLGSKREANVKSSLPSPSPSSSSKKPPKSPTGDSLDSVASPYSQAFVAWWELYPRKVGKLKAAKAYEAAVKLIKAERLCETSDAYKRLLDAVYAFANSDKGRGDRQFIPHPIKWLNEGRYDDDPEAWKENRSGKKTTDPGSIYTPGATGEGIGDV